MHILLYYYVDFKVIKEMETFPELPNLTTKLLVAEVSLAQIATFKNFRKAQKITFAQN